MAQGLKPSKQSADGGDGDGEGSGAHLTDGLCGLAVQQGRFWLGPSDSLAVDERLVDAVEEPGGDSLIPGEKGRVVDDERDAPVFGVAAALLVGEQQRDGLRLCHVVAGQHVEAFEARLQFGKDLALNVLALGAAGRKEEVEADLLGGGRCPGGKGTGEEQGGTGDFIEVCVTFHRGTGR